MKAFYVNSWGAFPQLALITSMGMVFLAFTNSLARFGHELLAHDLFFVGLLIIYAPIFFRLLKKRLDRRERIALLVWLTLSLYLVKVLHSPTSFTFHDEFLHWKTTDAILQSGRLFAANPLLPISPLYPGLHLTTASIAQITGLGIFESGAIMLGVVRVMMTIALFAIYESISKSTRVASLGVMIYVCNTNFVFFIANFAYESLALPMGLVVLVLLLRKQESSGYPAHLMSFIAALTIICIAATHHVTSYMMAAFFIAISVVTWLWPRLESQLQSVVDWCCEQPIYARVSRVFIPRATVLSDYERVFLPQRFIFPALLTTVAIVIWTTAVATPVLGYVSPIVSGAVQSLVGLILQSEEGRALFTSAGGNVRPIWERLTAVFAILLSGIGFLYGALAIWRIYRDRLLPVFFVFVSSAFFFTLGLRFTERGWEVSNRSSDFLYIGLGFVISLGVISLWRKHQDRARWRLFFTICACIMFAGGVLAGMPYWARVPGPYMVGADTRSVDPESILASEWVASRIEPDSRFIADRVNGLLMGTYGRQHVIRSLSGPQTAPVLLSQEWGDWERDILNTSGAEFVLVDYRLTTDTPELGVYVELGEPGGLDYDEPLSRAALEKFDALIGASRMFDSGNIVVFNVKSLLDEEPAP